MRDWRGADDPVGFLQASWVNTPVVTDYEWKRSAGNDIQPEILKEQQSQNHTMSLVSFIPQSTGSHRLLRMNGALPRWGIITVNTAESLGKSAASASNAATAPPALPSTSSSSKPGREHIECMISCHF